MKKASRGRGLRVGIAGAAAALATMAFGVSSASAQVIPFHAELDNAYLKTGAFPAPGLDILTPDPGPPVEPPAMLDGTVDVTNGAAQIDAADFDFPPFSGTVLGSIPVAVSLVATEDITGNVGLATGAVSTDPASFVATLTLDFDPNPALGQAVCAIGDPPGGPDTPDLELAFNTTQPFPSPFAGDTFNTPPNPADALVNGAIVATWPTLPAAVFVSGDPGSSCGTVDSLTGGRGALWIAEGLATPVLNAAPPPPPTCANTPSLCPPTPPQTVKCKKGFKKVKGKCKKAKKKKKKKK